ncbi:hypothetical protein, partial [Citrobacter portucalensis]
GEVAKINSQYVNIAWLNRACFAIIIIRNRALKPKRTPAVFGMDRAMKNNSHYENVILPIQEETKFINNKINSFLNPSNELKTILECVARHYPNGISEVLIPAMDDEKIKSLSYIELDNLSRRVNFLISTGYAKYFHYSETYLLKIRSECRKRYEQVIRDGYRVLDHAGNVIAYYGYVKGQYKLIEVNA